MSIFDDASSEGKTTNQAKRAKEMQEKLGALKGVRDLHFEIAFDLKLREKAYILDGEEAEKAYKVQKVCLSRVKNVTIVLYYFIVPYFETPDWCLKYFKREDTPSVDGIFVPCQ